ncbi:envelope integrity protein Cei [Amycolatopsis sp.]|uniref:envelope integrity protein Cei n=1 Tax=Amycolatopsis sp. TaxID=37632 RepID=UPI002CF2E518|nr:envelope integrity protein Cei [Amycolatopsis sp.]HVV12003.1 envelope integrity protein Cei [Amycolatopsis sp.]
MNDRRRVRREYRRRKPLPALVFITVLVVVAGIVWAKTFRRAHDVNAQVRCPEPATVQSGAPVGYTALDQVTPAPPGRVRVRVVNATSRPMLATGVAAELRSWGFGEAAAPSEDTVYPAGTLTCVGQIRFGTRGASAARTLSFLVPCAQLVRDDRSDTTVALALGERFSRLAPTPAGHTVLDQLRGRGRDVDGQQTDDSDIPRIARQLFADAHPGQC